MSPDPLEVIYEDNHLLAVVKPAGLATMGLRPDKPTLLAMAKQYIKQRYNKPGKVYLGVISRLDAPVTGVVLFARTSKAARRLSERFRSRQVDKIYWAVVEGSVGSSLVGCVDWLTHDERHRRMQIAGPSTPGAKEARLTYRGMRKVDGGSLLEVRLETGRKHQIRLQLSYHGYPILGDRKYGSRRLFTAGIALHARRLVVPHPVGNKSVSLEAPVPSAWGPYGVVE